LLAAAVSVAADGQTAAYAGRLIASVIDEFRAAGVELAYSTNVVTDDLYVAFEPEPGKPLDILRQILKPHGLIVREDAGIYLVLRDEARPASGSDSTAEERGPPDIENVIAEYAGHRRRPHAGDAATAGNGCERRLGANTLSGRRGKRSRDYAEWSVAVRSFPHA
jgi:hypothetical protein